VHNVRVYSVCFLCLSCYSGAACKYYGGLSYDGHMDDITSIGAREIVDYLKKIVCGLYTYACMVYLTFRNRASYI
jgi:hypothetical protein